MGRRELGLLVWLLAGLCRDAPPASAAAAEPRAPTVAFHAGLGGEACWLKGRTVRPVDEANLTRSGFLDIRWDGRAAWRRLSGAACGEAWPPEPAPACVVASVSVLPSRLPLFERALRSLLRQTRPPDHVYVVLPQRLKDRTGRLHKRTFDDPLPRYLFTDPRVKVLRPPEEDDLGTLDMLVPTLRALRARPPPGCAAPQRVWVVNDDVEYDAGLLESLLACAARHPSAACGSTGGRGYYGVLHKDLAGGTDDELRRVQPFLRAGGEVEVEWLQSVGGILYRTDFFAEDFLSFPRDADERILLEADWWFAGYLRARGVSLLHLPVLRPWWRALRSSVVNALSYQWRRTGHNPAKDQAILYFARRFGIWREECTGPAVWEDESCQRDIAHDSTALSGARGRQAVRSSRAVRHDRAVHAR